MQACPRIDISSTVRCCDASSFSARQSRRTNGIARKLIGAAAPCPGLDPGPGRDPGLGLELGLGQQAVAGRRQRR